MTSADNFRDRALRWLPGGSNGEYGIPEGDAPVIDRGAGAESARRLLTSEQCLPASKNILTG